MYNETLDLISPAGPSCRPVDEPEELPWFGEPRIEDNIRAGVHRGYQVIGGYRLRQHFDTEQEAMKELARRQGKTNN